MRLRLVRFVKVPVGVVLVCRSLLDWYATLVKFPHKLSKNRGHGLMYSLSPVAAGIVEKGGTRIEDLTKEGFRTGYA